MSRAKISLIVVGYSAGTILWITFSDLLAAWFSSDMQKLLEFSLVKGGLFVLISASLLAFVLMKVLRQEEGAARVAFEYSPAAMLIFDAMSGRVTDFNPAAERVLGASRSELASGTLHLTTGRSGASAVEGELDGRRIETDAWVLAESLGEGGPDQKSAVIVDSHMIGPLLESERRFRQVIEHAPVPMAVHAQDGKILALSRSWLDLSGYDAGEIRTVQDWIRLAHPEDGAKVRAMIRHAYDFPDRRPEGEDWIRAKDGRMRLWAFSAVGLGPWPDGRRVALSMAQDITEERARQAILQEREAFYRALTEQGLVGVYVTDGRTMLYVNPRLEEIFGYERGETRGRPISDFLRPDQLDTVNRHMEERLIGGVDEVKYEAVGIAKDGREILVSVHGRLAEISGQKVVIGVLQDITAQRAVEREAHRHLAQLQSNLRDTAAAISRIAEMRDPYTSGHEGRVGDFAAAIAAELGLDEETQRGLKIAGSLHDIGKIAIPAEILTRPGKLSLEEYRVIQRHSVLGYEVLRPINFPWPVAEVAHQHHERMDGSGYPLGLKGDAICLEARIVAVADVVEALSSHRPYRPSLGLDAALSEIRRGRGTLYDAAVVDACIRLVLEKDYPLGSEMQLAG